MIDRMIRFIEENELCYKNDKILVALSGGIDSVVLLHLLLKAGYDVSAAHCNFKLRAHESDEDEVFVKEFCKNLSVKLYVKTCDAKEFSKKNGLSIQEAARELRYGFFKNLAGEMGFSKIAVAHHADDNLETFFINFIRGSGVKGLKGIPVKRDNIIRPLMFASRDEITNFANTHNLSWREDSSNSSDKYLRNKIRHDLLPVLKNIAGEKNGILNSLDYLKQDAFIFEKLLQKEKERIVKTSNGLIIIEFDNFKDIPPEKLLFYILNDYGFTKSDTEDLIIANINNNIGTEFYSDKYEAVLDRNKLILKKKTTAGKKEYFIEKDFSIIEKPFKAKIEIINPSDIKPEELKNPNYTFLDTKNLKFPLKLRKWRQGDKFFPFGMKGSKLLSDYFNDIKLNKFQKEEVWVLESGGEIVCIIGFRISEKHKVSKATKEVLKIILTS